MRESDLGSLMRRSRADKQTQYWIVYSWVICQCEACKIGAKAIERLMEALKLGPKALMSEQQALKLELEAYSCANEAFPGNNRALLAR